MPRFLIERTYTVDMDSLPTVATRSKAIRHYHYPEIVWEHSHVVVGTDGTPKSFCVYFAPSEEMVREHANLLGDHTITSIYEVAGDVTPDDFPLTADPVV
jgi:Nickel responsive protein SCO4226-like